MPRRFLKRLSQLLLLKDKNSFSCCFSYNDGIELNSLISQQTFNPFNKIEGIEWFDEDIGNIPVSQDLLA